MCRIPTHPAAKQRRTPLQSEPVVLDDIMLMGNWNAEDLLLEGDLPPLDGDEKQDMDLPDLLQLLGSDGPTPAFELKAEPATVEASMASSESLLAEFAAPVQAPVPPAVQPVGMAAAPCYPMAVYPCALPLGGFVGMYAPPPEAAAQLAQPADTAPFSDTCDEKTKSKTVTVGVRRHVKTPQEAAEQQERIKKRRRESAQRSRARKNCIMKTLELENQFLRAENQQLRSLLAKHEGVPADRSSTDSGMRIITNSNSTAPGSTHSFS